MITNVLLKSGSGWLWIGQLPVKDARKFGKRNRPLGRVRYRSASGADRDMRKMNNLVHEAFTGRKFRND
jgi:hypothetical protein